MSQKIKACFLTSTVLFSLSFNAFSRHDLPPKVVNEPFKFKLYNSNIFPWINGEKTGEVSDHESELSLALLNEMRGASKSLKMALYGNEKQTWFLDEMRKIHSDQDVELQVVVDQKAGEFGEWIPANFTYPDTALLGQILGIKHMIPKVNKNGKPSKGSIMHNKFIIFDAKTVWTGTTNLSHTCMGDEYNANTSMILESKDIAKIFEEEFDQMFTSHLFGTRKEVVDANQELKFSDGTRVSVFFDPEDGTNELGIIKAIERAKKSIDIGMFFLTDSDIAQSMITAMKRGVKIRLIYDALASANKYSQHIELYRKGADVRVEHWGGKMHMKTAIIDGRDVIIGSQNWSANGSARNDENVLIVQNNTHLAAHLTDYFEKLWETVPESKSERDLRVHAKGKHPEKQCGDDDPQCSFY